MPRPEDPKINPTGPSQSSLPWGALALVAGLALIMGARTIDGSFVGGDDFRLVLNHVLVNRPSVDHALQLFKIVHRDLYQPIPLLSFSLEFAIGRPLGFFDQGPQAGAWFLHLNNVLLHAINACLVFLMVRRLSRYTSAALIAGVLFAVHPLQVEVVAWINGRMMLLSTLFALLTILAWARWLNTRRGGLGWAILTLLFVLLCGISKIRVSIPVLMLLAVPFVDTPAGATWREHLGAMLQRPRFTRRLLPVWLLAGLITGILLIINVQATAGAEMFSGAAANLHGPRPVRILLALAFYFEKFVWPSGLASWYPAPEVVSWVSGHTGRALLVVVPTLAALTLAFWRLPATRFGIAWFFAAIASTLPVAPSRNMLAADRYMYLPIIGFAWLIGVLWVKLDAHRPADRPWFARRGVPILVGSALVIAMVGTAWHVGATYRAPIPKASRIAELFPHQPHVWERTGWSYYNRGLELRDAGDWNDAAADFQRAIELAQREMVHDDSYVQSEALQLTAMARLQLGDAEEAIRLLHEAMKLEPDEPGLKARLADVYEDLGRFEEAAALCEEALAASARHNPTIKRLARLYRRLDRPADARRWYEKALENNEYDVDAHLSLVELDLEEATPQSYVLALRRLDAVIGWMPDDTAVRTNRALVLQRLGRASEAVHAYEAIVKDDPQALAALLNLASLYQQQHRTSKAVACFRQAVALGLPDLATAEAVHEGLAAAGRLPEAQAMWTQYVRRFPAEPAARAMAAWSCARIGDLDGARTHLAALDAGSRARIPMVDATTVLLALYEQGAAESLSALERVCQPGPAATKARRRLLRALEQYDARQPGDVWTYCLTARLLQVDPGNQEAAKFFTDLARKNCNDSACAAFVQQLGDS
jgi:tetratricopeptide (TPR) repeat protein